MTESNPKTENTPHIKGVIMKNNKKLTSQQQRRARDFNNRLNSKESEKFFETFKRIEEGHLKLRMSLASSEDLTLKIIYKLKLRPQESIILAYILNFNKKGIYHITHYKIMKDLNLSLATISKHIHSLKEKEYIKVDVFPTGSQIKIQPKTLNMLCEGGLL